MKRSLVNLRIGLNGGTGAAWSTAAEDGLESVPYVRETLSDLHRRLNKVKDADVEGLDLSSGRLENIAKNMDRLQFIEGDIQTVDLMDGHFIVLTKDN